MRIIAALHADASLLSSSGTALKQVRRLYAEGKLHIDCNLRVCPVSERSRAEGGQTEACWSRSDRAPQVHDGSRVRRVSSRC